MTDVDHTAAETALNGRYTRFRSILGKGAYKTVYRAFDSDEALEVAWNKLHVERLQKHELEKVSNEVKLLEQIHHNNIIRFFALLPSTERNGVKTIDFITEQMTSGTLKDYLKRAKAIKLKVIRRWSFNILGAIAYLHAQEPPIMHRDLKCDNIFINGHVGEVKIGDLGLSGFKVRDKADSVIGTPEFMAPELYESSYTEKVDIYAFGMCLLEMVTMEYPYSECTTFAQIFKKVYSGEKPKVLDRVLPGPFKNVILACLQRERNRPSAAQLLEDPLFKDWMKDPGTENNISILTGYGEKNGSSKDPGQRNGMDIEWSDPLGRPIEVSYADGGDGQRGRASASASNNSQAEPEVVAMQANQQGGFKVGLTIPIEDRIKRIEFPFDPFQDTSEHLAQELVEVFELPQNLVSNIRDAIEAQMKVAREQREVAIRNSTPQPQTRNAVDPAGNSTTPVATYAQVAASESSIPVQSNAAPSASVNQNPTVPVASQPTAIEASQHRSDSVGTQGTAQVAETTSVQYGNVANDVQTPSEPALLNTSDPVVQNQITVTADVQQPALVVPSSQSATQTGNQSVLPLNQSTVQPVPLSVQVQTPSVPLSASQTAQTNSQPGTQPIVQAVTQSVTQPVPVSQNILQTTSQHIPQRNTQVQQQVPQQQVQQQVPTQVQVQMQPATQTVGQALPQQPIQSAPPPIQENLHNVANMPTDTASVPVSQSVSGMQPKPANETATTNLQPLQNITSLPSTTPSHPAMQTAQPVSYVQPAPPAHQSVPVTAGAQTVADNVQSLSTRASQLDASVIPQNSVSSNVREGTTVAPPVPSTLQHDANVAPSSALLHSSGMNSVPISPMPPTQTFVPEQSPPSSSPAHHASVLSTPVTQPNSHLNNQISVQGATHLLTQQPPLAPTSSQVFSHTPSTQPTSTPQLAQPSLSTQATATAQVVRQLPAQHVVVPVSGQGQPTPSQNVIPPVAQPRPIGQVLAQTPLPTPVEQGQHSVSQPTVANSNSLGTSQQVLSQQSSVVVNSLAHPASGLSSNQASGPKQHVQQVASGHIAQQRPVHQETLPTIPESKPSNEPKVVQTQSSVPSTVVNQSMRPPLPSPPLSLQSTAMENGEVGSHIDSDHGGTNYVDNMPDSSYLAGQLAPDRELLLRETGGSRPPTSLTNPQAPMPTSSAISHSASEQGLRSTEQVEALQPHRSISAPAGSFSMDESANYGRIQPELSSAAGQAILSGLSHPESGRVTEGVAVRPNQQLQASANASSGTGSALNIVVVGGGRGKSAAAGRKGSTNANVSATSLPDYSRTDSSMVPRATSLTTNASDMQKRHSMVGSNFRGNVNDAPSLAPPMSMGRRSASWRSSHSDASNSFHDVVIRASPSDTTLGSTYDQKWLASCLELMEHSTKGRYSAVAQKLDSGVPASFADYDRRTPLHLASSRGNLEVVKLLIERGASVKAVDRWGRTPLSDAVQNRHDHVATFLRQNGAEEDMDVRSDAYGSIMLQSAMAGDLEEVRRRLVAGADANFADYDRRTALHLACTEGHLDIAELLLVNEAKWSARDNFGATPVDDAVRNGHKNILRLLRQYGAEIPRHLLGARSDTDYQLGLDLVENAAKGRINAVKKCIRNGANPNFMDYDKRTALHLAAVEGHVNVVELLLNSGANMNVLDRWGSSPREGAVNSNMTAVVDELDNWTEKLAAQNSTATGNSIPNGLHPEMNNVRAVGNLQKVGSGPLPSMMHSLADGFVDDRLSSTIPNPEIIAAVEAQKSNAVTTDDDPEVRKQLALLRRRMEESYTNACQEVREKHRATKVITTLPLPHENAVATTEVVTPPAPVDTGSPTNEGTLPSDGEKAVAISLLDSGVSNDTSVVVASLNRSDEISDSDGKSRPSSPVRDILEDVLADAISASGTVE